MIARVALATLALFCVLALAEGVLRLVDFRFELKPEAVEFGWPNPESRRALYAVDSELFWVPIGYGETLAQLRRQPAPEVVFLGDSCTEFSDYPEHFRDRVKAAGGELAIAKLGVGGWSSHQGLAQLQRDVLPLRPAAVTLYFGWNDHWMGFGVRDGEISSVPLSGLRLAQLLQRARIGWRSEDPPTLRVPESQFRRNLREMARASRAAGVVPVFVTAPTSHERGAEPEKLRERHLRDLQQLVPLHERYVEIVREVAKAEEAPLCDLAASYAELPGAQRRLDFTSDGIHLSASGAKRVSRLLQQCFESDSSLRGLLQ